MTCTLAVITAFLGPMQPGRVIVVPASWVAYATADQIAKAKECASKLGIKWKVAQ